MIRTVAHRVASSLPLLVGVITLTFFLIELAPGNAADHFVSPDASPAIRAAVIEKYGLNQSMFGRFWQLVVNTVRLDFGTSIVHEQPVSLLIAQTLPNTLLLSAITLAVLYPTGVLLGTAQAILHRKSFDSISTIASLLLYSMPSFWLAMMLQLLLGHLWPILPISGMNDAVMFDYMTSGEQLIDTGLHLILPGVAMGIAHAAGVSRYMRTSMLEVMSQDYITSAKAKGLSPSRILIWHGMRNAIIPIVTLVGLSLPVIFSGSVLVEVVFSWPGMGRLIVESIFAQDTPVITGVFFVYTLLVITGNTLADITLAWLDPRVRL